MRKVIRLTLVDQLKLAEFVKEHYTEKKVSDVEFAVLASEHFGSQINDNHVSATRNALGIPSTKVAIQALKPETIIERLEACEKAIGNLIRRLDAWEK
jgi:hypothetical protein